MWRAALCVCALGLAQAARAQAIDASPEANWRPPPPQRIEIVLNPLIMAWSVFDPRPGRQNVGVHFVRMPGGYTYLRAPGHEGDAASEFFKLSIQVQVANRAKWVAEMRERRRKWMLTRPVDSAPKPLSTFFDDDTLSPGDVVVAVEGVRVFRGSADFPWKPRDFVPFEQWRGGGNRRALRAIERENRRQR